MSSPENSTAINRIRTHLAALNPEGCAAGHTFKKIIVVNRGEIAIR